MSTYAAILVLPCLWIFKVAVHPFLKIIWNYTGLGTCKRTKLEDSYFLFQNLLQRHSSQDSVVLA